MAALRNTAIGLLRWAGHTHIAAACRRLAAQPAQALALSGIAFENCMTLVLGYGVGHGQTSGHHEGQCPRVAMERHRGWTV